MMRKFYIPKPYPNLRQIPLLAPVRDDDKRLFQHLSFSEWKGIFEPCSDIKESDAVILPHYLTDLATRHEYLESVEELARSAGKRLLVFTTQDNPEPILKNNAVIIRPSVFASLHRTYEIVAPGLVEDLGASHGHENLAKGMAPKVGFVGKADFDSFRSRVKYMIRNFVLRSGVNRDGSYFRRRAIRAIVDDRRIDSNIIMRRHFGAHRDTIELSIDEARAQYVQNIKDSLFTLAPRGDGNYSLRFYETLSLGRIPILIDTDIELPLESDISYEECILRIPYKDVDRTNEIVWNFWNTHSDDELKRMQSKAREIFETYLYYPQFLRVLFNSREFSDLLQT